MPDWLPRLVHANFPPVPAAWAYGSRVFAQTTKGSDSKSLLDLILVAEDVGRFHDANRRRNPTHYPLLMRYLPLPWLVWMNRWGPGLYYHAYIPLSLPAGPTTSAPSTVSVEGVEVLEDHAKDHDNENVSSSAGPNREFGGSSSSSLPPQPGDHSTTSSSSEQLLAKYGVISLDDAESDLLHWRYLYVAGRAHKPLRRCYFEQLFPGTKGRLEAALLANRQAALGAAVFFEEKGNGSACGTSQVPPPAPPRSSEEGAPPTSLGSQAASLGPSEELSDSLLVRIVRLSYDGDVRSGIAEHPKKLQRIVENQRAELCGIYQPIYDQFLGRGGPELEQKGAGFPLSRADLRSRVFWGSLVQTVKGVFTNSPRRTMRYAAAKVLKRLRG